MRECQAHIYALRDPTTGEIRYVGRASCIYAATSEEVLKKRLQGHIGSPGSVTSRKAIWLYSLGAQGLRPTIELLETVPEEEAVEAERRWLAYLRARGEKLTNNERHARKPVICPNCGHPFHLSRKEPHGTL